MMKPQPLCSRRRIASAAVAIVAQVFAVSLHAQPVTANGTTLNRAACPDALTGVFAGKAWGKCGAGTLSDSTVRMTVYSDVEGSGAAMKLRTDTAGERCDLTVAAGVVTVSAVGQKLSAALDGDREDTVSRTNDGRSFINAVSLKDRLEIAVEFDPKDGVQSAQATAPGRMLTCGLI